MLYDVRHVTTYRCQNRATLARCVLRLRPRDGCGQTCLGHDLALTPPARDERTRRDFFGNAVIHAHVTTAHESLRIESRARVRVARRPPDPDRPTPGLEETREAALALTDLGPDAPAHALFPSPHVAFDDAVTAYAAESFPPGRGVAAGARDLMRRIRADFDYRPQSTGVATPLKQAFAQRAGVCQDFAHVMIAGLRGLGLPARYVSGYIRTLPPPGKPRFVGADATHAWVSVWCGPQAGWREFDPTNAVEPGRDHIVVAIGRDFSDVSPTDGVFVGSGEQTIDVEVDVIALEAAE